MRHKQGLLGMGAAAYHLHLRIWCVGVVRAGAQPAKAMTAARPPAPPPSRRCVASCRKRTGWQPQRRAPTSSSLWAPTRSRAGARARAPCQVHRRQGALRLGGRGVHGVRLGSAPRAAAAAGVVRGCGGPGSLTTSSHARGGAEGSVLLAPTPAAKGAGLAWFKHEQAGPGPSGCVCVLHHHACNAPPPTSRRSERHRACRRSRPQRAPHRLQPPAGPDAVTTAARSHLWGPRG